MKYLCLIYLDEWHLQTLSPWEYAGIEHACVQYEDELRQSGHLLAVEALRPTEAATTVRVRGERVSVTDGPFAETREQLAGFYLLEARDLNDAIRMAARIPPATFGCVEVRPVREPRLRDLLPLRSESAHSPPLRG
jgi:hypothetical protein